MKGKRILLIAQYFPPETNAASKRMHSMAKSLSERYDVSIATLFPSYPSPEMFREIDVQYFDNGHSFDLIRAFEFLPHKGGMLLRAFREHLMALRLTSKLIRKTSPDIVIASSPSMFLGPSGFMIARLKNARFVWDIRDITWNYSNELNSGFALRFAAQLLQKYMLYILRKADLVIGATPGVTKLLIEDGLASERALTIANGISPELLNALRNNDGGKIKSRPIVTYVGVIGHYTDMGVILDVARRLPEIDFVLAGDGAEREPLEMKANKLGLKNVFFKGYVVKEDLIEVYSQSDILFAQVKSTPTLDATMIPTKLFEYMAAGKPIVYAGRGAASEFLSDIGCARIVPPGDVQAISDAIADLLEDVQERAKMGGRGRAFVEKNYNRDKLMVQLVHTLQEHFG